MSLCNFPAFSFSFSVPLPLPGLPSLPSLAFTLAFDLPCPLD